MQDGALSHSTNAVQEHWTGCFESRWIGRIRLVYWSARSPDLNSSDFYYWGHMRRLAYASPVRTIERQHHIFCEHSWTQSQYVCEPYTNVAYILLLLFCYNMVLLWTFAEAKKFVGRFSICSNGFPQVNRFKYRTSLNDHIPALVRQTWFRSFADLNVSSIKSTYQHVSHSRKECEWADDRPRMQQKMDQEELIENKYVVGITKNIAAPFTKKTCEGELKRKWTSQVRWILI